MLINIFIKLLCSALVKKGKIFFINFLYNSLKYLNKINNLNVVNNLKLEFGIRTTTVKGKKKLVPFIINKENAIKNFIKTFLFYIRSNKIYLKDSPNKLFEQIIPSTNQTLLLKMIEDSKEEVISSIGVTKKIYKNKIIINASKAPKKKFFSYI